MEPEPGSPLVAHLLIVEDNDGDARLISEFLKDAEPRAKFLTTRVVTLAAGLDELARAHFDVILLDLWLPDSAGVESVTRMCAACVSTPVIVVTGVTDQQVGVEALQAGAQDFFVKGRIDAHLLAKAVLRQTRSHAGHAVPTGQPGASIQVLLVEDNPGDARLLHEALLSEPIRGVIFNVKQVTHLSDALEAAAQTRFDVILLDLWLPDSGGVETVTRVRRQFSDIPLIVITGDTDEHIRREVLQAGAQDFLAKRNLDAGSLLQTLLRQVQGESAA